MEKHTGSCLCGAVTFEVRGAIPAPTACHCSKCRNIQAILNKHHIMLIGAFLTQ